MTIRESVQTVVLSDKRFVIDGLSWVVVKFACEVACESGDCPYLGAWRETAIDVKTCELAVELEGSHGEVDQARTYYGEKAMSLLTDGVHAPFEVVGLAEARALEQHEGEFKKVEGAT